MHSIPPLSQGAHVGGWSGRKDTLPRSMWLGNPKCYDTFLDEALNLPLRTCAERAHRLTMETSVFRCFTLIGILGIKSHIFGASELPRYRGAGPVADPETSDDDLEGQNVQQKR